MADFKGDFTTIKGISEKRRLPRLGKIRLGIKVTSKKTGNEYPKEVDYFVCPPEVLKIYKKQFPNGKITSLDIMFPINDPEVVFPQAYKYYGQTRGLKCIGNGEIANRVNEDNTITQVECPCDLLEQKKCQRRAHLLVMLPKVSMGGVYQIDLGSYHSIVDINSGIDYVRGLTREILGVDRFALIPLTLKREQRETHHDGGKQIHYTLHIYSDLNAEQWNTLKTDFRVISPPRLALPPIEDVNPETEEEATVIEEETEPLEPATPDTTAEIMSDSEQIKQLLKEREVPDTIRKQIMDQLPKLTKNQAKGWIKNLEKRPKKKGTPLPTVDSTAEPEGEKQSGNGEKPPQEEDSQIRDVFIAKYIETWLKSKGVNPKTNDKSLIAVARNMGEKKVRKMTTEQVKVAIAEMEEEQ